jgi:hypothetical protein
MWPDVPFSYAYGGWLSPGVAQYPASMAPQLAPRDLPQLDPGANASVSTLRVRCRAERLGPPT